MSRATTGCGTQSAGETQEEGGKEGVRERQRERMRLQLAIKSFPLLSCCLLLSAGMHCPLFDFMMVHSHCSQPEKRRGEARRGRRSSWYRYLDLNRGLDGGWGSRQICPGGGGVGLDGILGRWSLVWGLLTAGWRGPWRGSWRTRGEAVHHGSARRVAHVRGRRVSGEHAWRWWASHSQGYSTGASWVEEFWGSVRAPALKVGVSGVQGHRRRAHSRRAHPHLGLRGHSQVSRGQHQTRISAFGFTDS